MLIGIALSSYNFNFPANLQKLHSVIIETRSRKAKKLVSSTTSLSQLQPYPTEASLVNQFVSKLETGKSYWRIVQVATEWRHRVGFADILVRTSGGRLIAFEAKLSDWRRAFHQAYRNSSYANQVYVLLPLAATHRALLAREEFEYRGIGLCALQDGKIKVLIKASEQDALLTWIRQQAHEHFDRIPNESSADVGSCAAILQSA